MKTKSIAFFMLLAVALTGCKNEKSVDNLEVVKSEVVDKAFKVTLKMTMKKDDDIAVYYTEDGTSDFKLEPVWVQVKGSDAEQNIVCSLPEDVYPMSLRFDLGLKQDQPDLNLKGITVEYMGKKRDITGVEMAKFFRPNLDACTYDVNTGAIVAVVKDGKRVTPSLYPLEEPLKAELENLGK